MNLLQKIYKGTKKIFLSGIRKKTYTNGWNSLFDSYNTGGTQVYKSYAYACINARAENIAKARIYMQRKISGNQIGFEDVNEHAFLDIINKPNLFNQSFEILLFLISSSLDLYGNAYILIDRKKG